MKFSAIKKLCSDGGGGLWAATAIIAFGLASSLPWINDFPAYIHAWAQSDWYAIALGFCNNGYDLFHPETFIYNKQFPDVWCTAYSDTITSADMPLHGYIAALLMGALGSTSPWVYRLWTLLCSLAGLWFLFLLCRRLTQSWLKALPVVLMALTAPLYAYYFANFLPSAPALALVMAGLWAYIRYWQDGETRYWHLGIVFLTLAALTRTSQAVVLVAVCGFELLRVMRHETPFWKKVPAVIVGGLAIGGYMLWNAHLKAEHGSLFLGELMPPRNVEDLRWVWHVIKGNWQYAYFGHVQQWLLVGAAVGTVVALALRRRKAGMATTGDSRLPIVFLAAIWTFGELMFIAAMWRQFAYHDYYFLDSLWLPVLFWLALALRTIPIPQGTLWRCFIVVAMVLLSGICYNESKHTQQFRHAGYDMATDCYHNYLGSDRWLDSLGISRDARIISVASYPQNTPFILMGRKGYSVMWFGSDADVSVIANNAQRFPADYAVVENYLVPEHFDHYGEILRYMLPIADNGRLTLCRITDTEVNLSAEEFFAHPRMGGGN